MKKFLRGIYRFIDKNIVVPISRFIYYLSKKWKKNQGKLDKVLNQPHFLIYLSLATAVIMFLLIDSKVISLVETEAEVITNVPVVVKYNEEAYVIEGVPENVDITITGRKSDIYLAKQLGEYEVILDLSDYSASDTPYKVYFTYSKSIDSLGYKLDPSYVQVTVKNKESSVKTLSYDLMNIDELNNKLSVKSVTLNKSEVVVKGSSDALANISNVKALIDLGKGNYNEAGTYNVDNIELVAYNASGERLDNVEIVPSTTSATLVLDSYSKNVTLSVETVGTLLPGKSIASILINNNSDYSLTIYGEKSDIEKIDTVPVTINVDGLGNSDTKNYTVKITKPAGVREMSAESVNIIATFGEEKQKTLDISNSIKPINKADGLAVSIVGDKDDVVNVQVKGVQSVIDNITASNVAAYIDLSGLGVGSYEVDVKIDNKNPLLSYVVSSKVKIELVKE